MKNYYLYLIRHGITEGNLDGKYIGQTDLALCPQGEKQIQQLASQVDSIDKEALAEQVRELSGRILEEL